MVVVDESPRRHVGLPVLYGTAMIAADLLERPRHRRELLRAVAGENHARRSQIPIALHVPLVSPGLHAGEVVPMRALHDACEEFLKDVPFGLEIPILENQPVKS